MSDDDAERVVKLFDELGRVAFHIRGRAKAHYVTVLESDDRRSTYGDVRAAELALQEARGQQAMAFFAPQGWERNGGGS